MSETVNQVDNKPVRKVQAVGYSGVAVTLLLLLAKFLEVDLTDEVATDAVYNVTIVVTALTSLVNFATGYFVKAHRGDK